MKSFSKQSLILIVLALFAILLVGILAVQKEKESQRSSQITKEASEYMYPFLKDNHPKPQQPTEPEEQSQEQEQEEAPQKSDEIFITDVDMNIDNWQTKETEFFTIKFPKEWYWLELEHEENEGYSQVITNNPNFDIDRYADIGIGVRTRGNYSLDLTNDTEVILAFSGISVTSEIGSPSESINQQIEKQIEVAKEFTDSSNVCNYENSEVPAAYCHFTNGKGQSIYIYYIVGNEVTYVFSLWTGINAEVNSKKVLQQVVENFIEK